MESRSRQRDREVGFVGEGDARGVIVAGTPPLRRQPGGVLSSALQGGVGQRFLVEGGEGFSRQGAEVDRRGGGCLGSGDDRSDEFVDRSDHIGTTPLGDRDDGEWGEPLENRIPPVIGIRRTRVEDNSRHAHRRTDLASEIERRDGGLRRGEIPPWRVGHRQSVGSSPRCANCSRRTRRRSLPVSL